LYWARFLSFSLRLVREASNQRWQSYGCDPSMSLASTSFHKPALFLGDLGGTFREERTRVRDVCVEKCRLRDTPIMRRAICFRRAEWQRIKKTDLRYFHQNISSSVHNLQIQVFDFVTKQRTLSVHSCVRVMTGSDHNSHD